MAQRRAAAPLLVAGLAVGALAALPLAYLAIVVAGDPQAAWDAIWNTRTLELAMRSLGLAAAVTAAAIAIAVPIAWLTARTDLPGRRVWTVLTALPLVVPSYIGAYVFVSAFGPRGALQDGLSWLGVERLPSIYGFAGAWLVLTLFTYPLVLLTVRAAFQRLDPQLEEAARALGRGPVSSFTSVVLPQLRPAIAGGGLLVALYTLSDFGAVSIMRFNTFTREIYISYTVGFNRTAAAALAALLVVLMFVLLAFYLRLRSEAPGHRVSPGTQRLAPPVRLGRWRWPALAACGSLVGIAVVMPVAVLIYWATQGLGDGIDLSAIGANAANSLLVAGLAAAFGAVLAMIVAMLALRQRGALTGLIERVSYTGYALPGIVIALSLVFFATRVVLPLYQTLALLVVALTIHYLPVALGAVSAALLQIPPRLEEAARTLGRSSADVARTVTAPLAAAGIAGGAALLFLNAIKELPATLVLAPIGFETLAMDIWQQTTTGFFEAAAVPALVLLAIAAPPLYLLSGRGVAR